MQETPFMCLIIRAEMNMEMGGKKTSETKADGRLIENEFTEGQEETI